MNEQRAVPEIQKYLAACPDLWEQVVRILDIHATLTAERDALSLVLRQGADAAVDLRKKYEALKLERDGLKQQLADSELAFAHANEVVGKLEADVARLSAPVTEEELGPYIEMIQPTGEDACGWYVAADQVHALLASRTAPAKETK